MKCKLTSVAEFAWAILRAAQNMKEVRRNISRHCLHQTSRALGPLQHLLSLTAKGTSFNAVHAAFLEVSFVYYEVS